jgi:hypothetical protein
MLWQDKELIGTNLVTLFPDLVPAAAIHTEKKEVLRETLLAISVMIAGLGVISHGTDVQMPEHGIRCHP